MTTERSETKPVNYVPITASNDARMRATRDDVVAAIRAENCIILDHRSLEEYRGELHSPPGTPNHGSERLGHIPGARHLHFEDMLDEDMSFKPVEDLRAMLAERGATLDKNIISYCRLSHRATLAYFVMTQLLGYSNLRVYDGSWTEWGSLVGAPIEL